MVSNAAKAVRNRKSKVGNMMCATHTATGTLADILGNKILISSDVSMSTASNSHDIRLVKYILQQSNEFLQTLYHSETVYVHNASTSQNFEPKTKMDKQYAFARKHLQGGICQEASARMHLQENISTRARYCSGI